MPWADIPAVEGNACSPIADHLHILKGHGIGYALWNFRGSFGLVDSGRADIEYEDWHGHKLDRRLLTLLQKY